MKLNNKEYDENDPKELVQVAIDISDAMDDALGTVHWTKCLDDSARCLRRLAHAMDVMRESTIYVEHAP